MTLGSRVAVGSRVSGLRSNQGLGSPVNFTDHIILQLPAPHRFVNLNPETIFQNLKCKSLHEKNRTRIGFFFAITIRRTFYTYNKKPQLIYTFKNVLLEKKNERKIDTVDGQTERKDGWKLKKLCQISLNIRFKFILLLSCVLSHNLTFSHP